jgi:hypothetical protein
MIYVTCHSPAAKGFANSICISRPLKNCLNKHAYLLSQTIGETRFLHLLITAHISTRQNTAVESLAFLLLALDMSGSILGL